MVFVSVSARDCDHRCQIITRDFPGMTCLPQVLGYKPSVRTAVIPTAGLIGGLFPASKAVSPGLLPIYDSDGVLKPAGQSRR